MRRLRLSQILSIILIVTIFYIIFQLFILNKLNIYNSNKQTVVVTQYIDKGKKSTEKLVIDDEKIEIQLNQTINSLFHYDFLKHNEILPSPDNEDNSDKNYKTIKGVNKKSLYLYQPDSLGQFRCIKSKVLNEINTKYYHIILI
jgi:hypothetical protein